MADITTTLDDTSGISDIEANSDCGCFCLTVILMSDSSVIPSKASFEAVIRYVREIRIGLDQAVNGLDHPPTDAALGYANGMRAGLDTALITLEHLARLAAKASQVVPTEAHKKHLLHICGECDLAFFPDTPHDCETAGNGFTQADLNRLVGWQGYRVKYPNGMWDDPVNPDEGLEPGDNSDDGEAEADAAEAEPDDADDGVITHDIARSLGMREGSKKHRVYEAIRTLLEQNGPMHIDDMLENVMALGVFAEVKNPRVNFANLLSQFRNKRLVDSDYQGTYSLPNGKATD